MLLRSPGPIRPAIYAGHIRRRVFAQILQIRLEPAFQIALTILFHCQPPSKLAPYESRIFLTGNPKNHTSAKVALEHCFAIRGMA
jgi:hypothetical protein